jgi:sugar lactone lactonase YvrE
MQRNIFLLIMVAMLHAHGESQTAAQLEWYNIYDGPSHGVDIPNDATLDRSGNFYITGRSSSIGTGQDYLTVKYSPSGQQLLELRYNSPANSWDEATAIVVDDSGYIYVTGESAYSSSDRLATTIKYDQTGAIRWMGNYPSDSSFNAGANSIQLDNDGNLYVAGSPDLTVLKYSNSGMLLWDRTFRRDTSMVNVFAGCVVGANGDVYITGAVSEDCPEGICRFDAVTVKYDANGNRQWVRYYTEDTSSNEQPVAIAIDSQENIIVAGAGQGDRMFIVKYSPNGDELWVRRYEGASFYAFPHALAIDDDDNVIVAGTTWNQAFDYYAVKYSPTGTQLWFVEYNHDNVTRDFASGLAVDHEGSVYVTGGSRFGFLGTITCVTVKFNSSGDHVWTSSFNRPDTGTGDYGQWMFIDSVGNVYVAGDGAGPINGLDYIAIKLNQITVGVNEPEQIPVDYVLHQNYPNPFNPSTVIRYQLPVTSFATLKVYNLLGQEVATLVNEVKQAGRHEVTWGAEGFPSGVYFYRLSASSFVETRKLMLVR